MRTTLQSIGISGAVANGTVIPGGNTYVAPGYTPWTPVNYLQLTFAVTMAAIPSSDAATVAFSGQYTTDPQDGNYARPVSMTRAGTTVTVTDPGHGLTTGDSVTVFQGGAPFDGYVPTVTVTNATTYTYTVVNAGLTVAAPTVQVISARVFSISGITGATRVAAAISAEPVQAVRLNVTTLTAGFIDWVVQQGLGSC